MLGLILSLLIWLSYYGIISSTEMEQFLAKASNQRGDTAFAMVMIVGMLKYVLLISGICLPLGLLFMWIKKFR